MENLLNKDYAAEYGSLPYTAEEVGELNKALNAPSDYQSVLPGDLSGAAALGQEDLSAALRIVTYSDKHLKLWRDIRKADQTQIVHQFNVLNSYGQDAPITFKQGGLPAQTDSDYSRETKAVKFLATFGQVTHPGTLIQAAHGSIIAREVINKTIQLLGSVERGLFEYDSSINADEFDGVEKQIVEGSKSKKYKSDEFLGYSVDAGQLEPIYDSKGSHLI